MQAQLLYQTFPVMAQDLYLRVRMPLFTGGTTYDCGPVLVDAEKDVTVDTVKWRAIRKTAVGDGTDDAIIFRGANCKVVR